MLSYTFLNYSYYLKFLFFINIYIYIVLVQYAVKKIKNNLRNLQAENDPKFKKRAGWPKNLVSYKKKRVARHL